MLKSQSAFTGEVYAAELGAPYRRSRFGRSPPRLALRAASRSTRSVSCRRLLRAVKPLVTVHASNSLCSAPREEPDQAKNSCGQRTLVLAVPSQKCGVHAPSVVASRGSDQGDAGWRSERRPGTVERYGQPHHQTPARPMGVAGGGGEAGDVNRSKGRRSPMTPLGKSRHLAARMGRWSASHWKTATFGWLAFVVAAFAIGNVIGTKNLDPNKAGSGESGHVQSVLADEFKQPANENVIIKSTQLHGRRARVPARGRLGDRRAPGPASRP